MKTVLRIMAVLLAALPILAEQKTPPPPAPPRAVRWPKIDERHLANGLTVVLVPLPNVPKVTMRLGFFVVRDTRGVAQLTGRVLTEGTATRTSKQIKEELRSIGGSLDATSDEDAMTIIGTSLSEFMPRLVDLFADVARRPAFPAGEVALAKTNFAGEIEEQRSDPNFLANEQMAKAVFGSDPYGFTVPDPTAIKTITRDEVKAFAAKWYAPNNAYLIVVGDFDAGAVMSTVEKAFGDWKKVELPKREFPPLPKSAKRQIWFVNRPGSVQSVILIGNAAPPRKSPDYISLRTANMILGGSFYSRLTKNIRESKGYTYTPGSTAFLRRRAGLAVSQAAVRNEVTGPTILEMLYELDRMRVLPVTDEELNSAKIYSNGTMALEMETQAGFAGRVESIYKYGLQRDFLETFVPKVNALTPADIEKSAAKYFDTYRGAIVVVGDYEKVKDQVAPFGDVKLIQPR